MSYNILVILMFMMFCIALNGVDCPLNFYGPSMFKEFGFTISAALISCIIPLGQLLGYIFAPFLMSVISKKRQYLLACIIMVAASCSLALSYYAKSVNFQPIIVQQVGLAVGSLGLAFVATIVYPGVFACHVLNIMDIQTEKLTYCIY